MKLRGMTLVMTRPTLSTNSVSSVHRAVTSKVFFSPLGRFFFSCFFPLCAQEWHYFGIFYTAATAALGGSRLCVGCEQGLRGICGEGVNTKARGQISRWKKKPSGGKKKTVVLPRLQVWLKKRGSVRPTSFVFARKSGITLASFIRPLRRLLAGPASVSFASKASVAFARKESIQRPEDR